MTSPLCLALAVASATVVLVILRPGRLNEAWFAFAGASVAVLLGLAGWDDIEAIWHQTRSVLLFLAGMMVAGVIADRAGIFEWAAVTTARMADGSARRLYAYVFVLGALITAFLSLDATAVVLTPIVYNIVRRLRLDPMPYLLACTYVANTASLPFPVSNLTNLLVAEGLNLGFWPFAAHMLLPNALALAVNLGVFWLLFRREIGERFDPALLGEPVRCHRPADDVQTAAGAAEGWHGLDNGSRGSTAPPDQTAFFRASLVLLIVLFAGFAIVPPLGGALWAVAVAGAAVMTALSVHKGWIDLRTVASGVSWSLLPFVFCLFVVVRAVENAGLAAWLVERMQPFAPGVSFGQIVGLAGAVALGANVINNVPMTLVALTGLTPLVERGEVHPIAAYAALLGTNLGPNLTVLGSLATMLALGIARKQGLDVPGWHYLRIGLVALPPILVAAALGLWVSARFWA